MLRTRRLDRTLSTTSFSTKIRMQTGWISLSFDDALNQHLDHAAPILTDAGLVGTFYIPLSAPAFISRTADWQRVSRDGHELGNHTVFHPADSRKAWVRPGNAIDWYSLDRMRLELEFASQVLQTVDGLSERTFAYPCGNSFVGSRGWVRRAVEAVGWGRTRLAGLVDQWRLDLGSTLKSYEPVAGDLFVAARGGGLVRGQAVPPTASWRRTQLLSVAVDDWSLRDLQSHVTDSVRSGTWTILQFHGVGGGHRLNCSLTIFQGFVAWLQGEYGGQVITVLEGARRIWGCDSTRSDVSIAPPSAPVATTKACDR